MPTLTAQKIEDIAFHAFRAAGASDDAARVVAEHLRDANLAGHDSHGLLRILQYTSQIKSGVIDPKATPEVVDETPTTAQVDGHSAFGQVVAKFATEIAIDKARNMNVSCVTMRNVGHLGRLGAYTTMAAEQGMAAIAFCGSGGVVHIQAPFGGREGRVCTNPMSIAVPGNPDGAVMADFATSVAAEGKLRVFIDKGQDIPDDWVYDKDGNPTTNPQDLYEGGAIRPFGGEVGHKGYCLAYMTEVFGGILTRDGYAHGGESDFQGGSSISNGTTIVVINVESIAPLGVFKEEVGNLSAYMKDTPLAPGFDEILYPGEKETKTTKGRLETGIDIPDATWDQISSFIDECGIREELVPLPE
jgi:uncharacterized oxidoreductase